MKREKKMVRKVMCLTGCLVLSVVLLSGCKSDSVKEEITTTTAPTVAATPTVAPTVAPTEAASEEVTITDGIYYRKFTAEGRGDYEGVLHFYENGIFYLGLYSNKMTVAGYYEIVDQEMEYIVDDTDPEEKGTATQVIKLTNLDGSEYAVLPYANDTVYDIPTYYNMDFAHVIDSDHTEADEVGVTVAEYMLGDDVYSIISIKHNGTFQDAVVSMVEGSWTKEGNVYTLTNVDSGVNYSLTLSEDGSTAEYVGEDGTKQTLNKVVQTAEVTQPAQ